LCIIGSSEWATGASPAPIDWNALPASALSRQAEAGVDDQAAQQFGHAGDRQHARIEARRDDQEADCRRDVGGFHQHLPQAVPVEAALEKRDDQGARGADRAGLDRREQAAVVPALACLP
jgi:hypothetical protein